MHSYEQFYKWQRLQLVSPKYKGSFMTHRIHATGIFTYMDVHFLCDPVGQYGTLW